MSETRTGWAKRRARFDDAGTEEAARAVWDDAAELVADVSLAAAGEVGPARGGPSRDRDEVGTSRRDERLRSAVNDLQHRLLTADPQADVHGFALERLMTAAGADRVCAFRNTEGADDRAAHVLSAEAVVAPELSLLATAAATAEAYDDVVPGLLEDLAAGRPFASRVEFLPRRAAERLAAQGADAVLLLPLFVDGAFHGFLRLDQCDRARLWSQAETAVLVSAAGSISAAIERQQVVTKMLHHSHELAALLATSLSITSSIDYDVVAREVVRAAAEALNCPESVIWEYSDDDMATCRALFQKHPRPDLVDAVVGSTYPVAVFGGGLEVVSRGVVTQQSLSDPDFSDADRADMLQWGEKTWLNVPLVYGQDALGAMILIESERERRFTDDETRMAALIGEQAAAALHNARLHRREEDQHRWLAALAEATRVIASRLDRIELLQDVARLATDALLVDSTLVYELGEHTGAFTPRALAGETVAPTGAATIDAEVADALRRGELVLHLRNDDALAADTVTQMDAAGEQTVVWVPFRINDETLGAMRLVEHSKSRRFAEAELSFAHALGEHAAIALNNARLYEQIEDQATKDGLTGLANHRHFYDRLAQELERASRTRQPVTLLMFDIDDFKRLNDTYGHPAGDEVLRTIGGLMQAELRKGCDLAARYGGEEFCVILPGVAAVRPLGGTSDPAPETGAAALAERLRRSIASFPFALGAAGDPAHVTVSIGVASWPNGAEGLDELVGRADAALYAAKRAGKDRVEVY